MIGVAVGGARARRCVRPGGRALAPVDFVADHSDAVLFALMFFVGISVGGSRGLLGKLRQYHVRVLIVPAGIVIGSVLGGLACAPLVGMSLPEGAAVASGLGWYSLAGVMMTDIAGAQAGSITFLANLLRELVSFFSIPWIAKHLNYPTCIAPAGATSEDTTLPMLIRCTNGETVVLSGAQRRHLLRAGPRADRGVPSADVGGGGPPCRRMDPSSCPGSLPSLAALVLRPLAASTSGPWPRRPVPWPRRTSRAALRMFHVKHLFGNIRPFSAILFLWNRRSRQRRAPNPTKTAPLRA